MTASADLSGAVPADGLGSSVQHERHNVKAECEEESDANPKGTEIPDPTAPIDDDGPAAAAPRIEGDCETPVAVRGAGADAGGGEQSEADENETEAEKKSEVGTVDAAAGPEPESIQEVGDEEGIDDGSTSSSFDGDAAADPLSHYVALKLEVAEMRSSHDLLKHRQRLDAEEADRLRASLESARAERDEALARVGELRSVMRHTHKNARESSEERARMRVEMERLREENERLKGALEKSREENEYRKRKSEDAERVIRQNQSRQLRLARENTRLKRRLRSHFMAHPGNDSMSSLFTTEEGDHHDLDPSMEVSNDSLLKGFQSSFRTGKTEGTIDEGISESSEEEPSDKVFIETGANASEEDKRSWFDTIFQKTQSQRVVPAEATDAPDPDDGGISQSSPAPCLKESGTSTPAPIGGVTRGVIKKQVSWKLPRLMRQLSTDDVIHGEGAYDTADPTNSGGHSPNNTLWGFRAQGRRGDSTSSSICSQESTEDNVVILRPQLGAGKSVRAGLVALWNGSGDLGRGSDNIHRTIMEERESDAILRRTSCDYIGGGVKVAS